MESPKTAHSARQSVIIAKAVPAIKGAARFDLNAVLKELSRRHLEKAQAQFQGIPTVAASGPCCRLTRPRIKDGDLFAKPMEWQGRRPLEPIVLVIPAGLRLCLGRRGTAYQILCCPRAV